MRLQINPAHFDMHRLLVTLLGVDHKHLWRRDVEIIPAYMPPFPSADTKPRVAVRWGNWFLRYSHGPDGEPFWDVYGDDFMMPELALKALLSAPAPPMRP